MTKTTSRISGFYNLSIQDRIESIKSIDILSTEEINALVGEAGLSVQKADHMIENVVGLFSLPIGLALNFMVNGKEMLIPMAVEEPSIIAGASFMAKLARNTGGFRTKSSKPEMIGQMQLLDISDLEAAKVKILASKGDLLAAASEIDPILMKLGGGPKDIEVREIAESPIGPFIVVHLIYDVRDAMGANAINTACEKLAPMVEALTGGRVHLRILSNLADKRLARATATFALDDLAFNEFSGEQVRDGILDAWAFAAADPYRAATHNKGIMNGIDPIVIATGNDWRAVEAGAHAYAARDGRYTSLTHWAKDAKGSLVGTLELPLAVGIVGGATKVHPAAQAALKLMGVKSASDLAGIMAAAGLAQNLAALRALSTEGIQRGHMSLHARQVAIAAGAQGETIQKLADALVAAGTVRVDHAEKILAEWRTNDEK